MSLQDTDWSIDWTRGSRTYSPDDEVGQRIMDATRQKHTQAGKTKCNSWNKSTETKTRRDKATELQKQILTRSICQFWPNR
jgi:hypothetical protein